MIITVLAADLGFKRDPSAASVIQWQVPQLRSDPKPVYDVVALKRWPLLTPYSTVVGDLMNVGLHLPSPKVFVFDYGGVGIAVVQSVIEQMVKAGVRGQVIKIASTGGLTHTHVDTGEHHVGKRLLVSNMEMLLACRRIRIAKALRETSSLAHELQVYRMQVTAAGTETFGAMNKDHDDLAMSLMLGCFAATTFYSATADAIKTYQHQDARWDPSHPQSFNPDPHWHYVPRPGR